MTALVNTFFSAFGTLLSSVLAYPVAAGVTLGAFIVASFFICLLLYYVFHIS